MTARADPADLHRWPTVFRSEIACDLRAVYDVIRSAKGFLVARGLTDGDAAQWELVMAEAANNGIQYCRPEARHQPLLLEVTWVDGRVVARLTDHTAGLNLPENPTLPPPTSEHGRGLFLIRHFTDAVTYHRHPDHNVLEMQRSHAGSR
ncbi:MAG: ATP-binding protein [Verrucomicrobiales bacterium]|nr:ATP-binding protein [Verrucomicrobiales bacterium]